MKRILITGISGFVGTNLVRYFKGSNEFQFVGYSRNLEKAKALFSDIEFLPEFSAVHLDRYLIDTVIHLAGIAHDLSGHYVEDDYHRVNFQWTSKIYDEFIKSKAKKFVFTSSVKALVDHSDQIINEEFIPNPTSDYGKSKRLAEEYIQANQKSGKTNYILRPCMIHGPGNKGNLNLLYKFVKAGIPYPLAVFQNRRSFISIENFCFTIQQILGEKIIEGSYLLADSEAISTNDLVKLIAEVRNKKIRVLKVSKNIIFGLAKFGSWVNAPFNSISLGKLVENMEVSNKKLLLQLDSDLPVSAVEGLKRTIRSFDE